MYSKQRFAYAIIGRDHVPFRNSKLTRMLQPSLSGDARISVVCTINPSKDAVVESTSTLLFAQRIKRVQVLNTSSTRYAWWLIICYFQLHAQKKEIVDTEALLERYRKEIEELKQRLAEREKSAEAPLKRRLSAREVSPSYPCMLCTAQSMFRFCSKWTSQRLCETSTPE